MNDRSAVLLTLSLSSHLIVYFPYSLSHLTHILWIPGERVAMVTGQGWTPMGHFHLTEMSPVCTWVRLSCRGGNLPKRRCARMCVCVCACMCAHVCVCVASVSYKMPSLEKLMWYELCYFSSWFWGFILQCFLDYSLNAERAKPRFLSRKATFCLLISYINSSRIFHSIVHQSFI